MKKIFLAAAALLMGLSSCTEEVADMGNGNPDGDMTVRFTLSLPGSGEVVYPQTRAAIQDEPEYTIKKLTLYEFAVGDDATTLLKKHEINTGTDLQSLTGGQYSYSMKIDAEYYGQKRRFAFVANDSDLSGIEEGTTTYENFCNTLATVSLVNEQDASKLAETETGIAMTGSGKVNEQEVFELQSSFACSVVLTRVDVINKTPNMVITDISMKQAAQKAFLMPQISQTAPGAPDYIETLACNASVSEKLNKDYETQNNSDLGIQKALYMYERENSEGNTATIEITYKLNNGTKGSLSVPFKKTDDQAWVNIERNHLYKVVLGNGQPVVTDKVEVQLLDEDWNVVEIPSDVDCEQDRMNAALKVNRFTAFNVKSISGTTVTFYDKLDVAVPSDPKTVYFTWSELQEKNLTKSDGTEILQDESGNKYRLPTEGELNLLLPMWTEPAEREKIDESNKYWGVYHPWWNNNESTNPKANPSTDNYVMATDVSTTGWVETIYLKNGSDNYPDKVTGAEETDGDYVIKGRSWMKRSDTNTITDLAYPADPGDKKYNVAPVYGLRFQGTSQYAAYRWESCKIDGNELERYLSIKIKALKKDDGITTIDDVAQESFWEEGYIEFKFPASGYYAAGDAATTPTAENISSRGVNGYDWSSSLWDGGSSARSLYFSLNNANVSHGALGHRFPLRLVRVEE